MQECSQPEEGPGLSQPMQKFLAFNLFVAEEAAEGEPVASGLCARMIYCGIAVAISMLESTQLFV